MCEYIAWVHGKERKYATILSHGYIRSGEDNYQWHSEGHIWEGRDCANGTYGHIRISADESVRAACRWDSGCANGSHGSMIGSKYATILSHGYIRSGEDNYRWHREGCI